MKHKLLLLKTMSPAGTALLRDRDDIEVVSFPPTVSPQDFRAMLPGVHGVALGLTPFRAAEMAAAPQMKAVARIGVGYDTVDVDALTRAGVPLLIAGTANAVSVAEQAMFFLLWLAKRGLAMHECVVQDRWASRLENLPVDVCGKTVLIVGCGRVGLRMLRRCVAMEMRVRVYDPYLNPDVVTVSGGQFVRDLDEGLADADFVTVHCPKTPQTVGMFDARRLAAMKPGAFLVNTARGGIVDEAALHAALIAGQLGGAGLDVFDPEPPRPDNPLLRLPNVITAPHVAGVSREAVERMAVATVRNLLDVIDGRVQRENVVNQSVLG